MAYLDITIEHGQPPEVARAKFQAAILAELSRHLGGIRRLDWAENSHKSDAGTMSGISMSRDRFRWRGISLKAPFETVSSATSTSHGQLEANETVRVTRRGVQVGSRYLATPNRDSAWPGPIGIESPGRPGRGRPWETVAPDGRRSLDQARSKGDDSQQDEGKPGGHGTGDHDSEHSEDEQRDAHILGKSVELAGKLQV